MSRNPVIEKALKKGFKSGGTIGDIGGGTGVPVRATGGGVGGRGSGTRSEARRLGIPYDPAKDVSLSPTERAKAVAEQERKQQETLKTEVKKAQRQVAQRKLGVVTRREVSPEGEVTYYGIRGQKYTFPSETQVAFTGRERFGGIPTEERPTRLRDLAAERQAEKVGEQIYTSLMARTDQPLYYINPAMTRPYPGAEPRPIYGVPGRETIRKRPSELTREEQLGLIPDFPIYPGVEKVSEIRRQRELERMKQWEVRTNETRSRIQKVFGKIEMGAALFLTRGEKVTFEDIYTYNPQVIKETGRAVIPSVIIAAPTPPSMKAAAIGTFFQPQVEKFTFETAPQFIASTRESFTSLTKPLMIGGAYAISPEKAFKLYKEEDIEKAFRTPITQKITEARQKEYGTEQLLYGKALDLGLAFRFPLQKTTYEVLKPESRLTTPEKVLLGSVGFAFGVGTRATKYFVERALVSEKLATLSRVAPKPAKLAQLGLIGTEKAIQFGLPAAYVSGQVGALMLAPTEAQRKFLLRKQAEELGYLTLGALPGSYLTGRGLMEYDAWRRTRLAKFRSLEKLVRKEVILGEETFPTAPPKIQYQLFLGQRKFRLPVESGEGLYGYHVTPGQLPRYTLTLPGKARPGEPPGFFLGTEASIYFARLSDSIYQSYSFKGGTTISPTIIRQAVLGFRRIPKKYRGRLEQFMFERAKKGYAYLPEIKPEIEAVEPPGTPIELFPAQAMRRTTPYYTRVPSERQAARYEFMERGGYQEALKRAGRIDKLLFKVTAGRYGRRPGTFKRFGIREGIKFPIEVRKISLKNLENFSKSVAKSFTTYQPYGSYSYGRAYAVGAYSFSVPYSSRAMSSRVRSSAISSRAYRYFSYRPSYQPSYRYSYIPSYRPSYRPSYQPSYTPSYRYSYRPSYQPSYRPSYRYSPPKPPPPPPPPPDIPNFELKLRRKPTKPKAMKYARLRYQPSLVAVQERITGVQPKILTGLKIRPITRI